MSALSKMLANLVKMQVTDRNQQILTLVEAISELGSLPTTQQTIPPEAILTYQPLHTPPPPKKRVVLAHKGQVCTCDKCGDLYQINDELIDGLKVEDFIKYFTPIGHSVPMPYDLNFWPVNDAVLVDCPVCKGETSLLLWGRRPETKVENNVYALGDDDVKGLGL